MTSVRGRRRLRRERLSVAPSIAPSIVPPDSFPPLESDDKLDDQPTGFLEPKPPVNNAPAATSILKYSEDDLQRIFKAVLEAKALVPAPAPIPAPALVPAPISAPAPAPAPAPIVPIAPREKLKARFSDVYHRKSYMDYYNFCQ